MAWHPDRLARNSVDGGAITYLLDRGKLKDLKFPAYSFENTAQGKFMLQIMFGYSKYYVDSMSDNIRRGVRRKLELGILPNRAPVGYRNDRDTRTIAIDPRTYPVVRRIWDHMLTGTYGVNEIARMAREDWGFRTPRLKRSGGKPLAISTVYKIFSNRFYAGDIVRKGEVYRGSHQAMVTRSEFDHVQALLHRPMRPSKRKHVFAYTGLIRCGSCGGAITAENKINRQGHHYIYYHCTRRFGRCHEPSIAVQALEAQIADYLKSIRPPKGVADWGLAEIAKRRHLHVAEDAHEIEILRQNLSQTEKSLQTLTDLRIRGLIGDEDFLQRREAFRIEIERARDKIAARQAGAGDWFEPARRVISFSNLAISCFERGNERARRTILSICGSNLTLSGKKLSICAPKPFALIPKMPDLLHLCWFIDAIRTLSDEERFRQTLERMRELEVQFAPDSLDEAA